MGTVAASNNEITHEQLIVGGDTYGNAHSRGFVCAHSCHTTLRVAAGGIDLFIDPVLINDLNNVYLINAIKAARSQWHGLARCLLFFSAKLSGRITYLTLFTCRRLQARHPPMRFANYAAKLSCAPRGRFWTFGQPGSGRILADDVNDLRAGIVLLIPPRWSPAGYRLSPFLAAWRRPDCRKPVAPDAREGTQTDGMSSPRL
jgi:hypothetical protein